MKPDYIFIGPHKSGTTWIDNYLRHRGDVHLPQVTKETFFFDKVYHRGWGWYEAQFGERDPEHKICVEVAPSLLDKPEAAERVAKDLPNVTVIGTLRNPIDRAIAHYFHYLKGGEPDWGFRKMAENHAAMVSNGLYYKNLNMWVDLLGKDQVKLLNYHDLNTSPDGYVRSVCDVLGLPYKAAADEVLYARINEDGDPAVRLLARATRRGARTMRMAGMHWLVNGLKQPMIRRMVYGPRPSEEKRERLRREAQEFYDEFFADFSHLDSAYGFDTTLWRRTEES